MNKTGKELSMMSYPSIGEVLEEAKRREDGLREHNFNLMRENRDLRDRIRDQVNTILKLEKELEGARAEARR